MVALGEGEKEKSIDHVLAGRPGIYCAHLSVARLLLNASQIDLWMGFCLGFRPNSAMNGSRSETTSGGKFESIGSIGLLLVQLKILISVFTFYSGLSGGNFPSLLF
jgi:hypothetical protein